MCTPKIYYPRSLVFTYCVTEWTKSFRPLWIHCKALMGLTWFSATLGVGDWRMILRPVSLQVQCITCFLDVYPSFPVSWHIQWSKVIGSVSCLISWRQVCVHIEKCTESLWLPPLAFKCLLSEIPVCSASCLWIKAAEVGDVRLKSLQYATCVCYLVSELWGYGFGLYQLQPWFSLRSWFLPFTCITEIAAEGGKCVSVS